MLGALPDTIKIPVNGEEILLTIVGIVGTLITTMNGDVS